MNVQEKELAAGAVWKDWITRTCMEKPTVPTCKKGEKTKKKLIHLAYPMLNLLRSIKMRFINNNNIFGKPKFI